MRAGKTVAFYTLGCKLNYSETSAISQEFHELGYARVEFGDRPDIVVINTCSVTENADRKCRQIVSKALNINPETFVIVVGCYAQLKPVEISKIKGVDLVLGAHEKFNISVHLESFEKKPTGEIFANDIRNPISFVPSYSIAERTRSFLKVQDGCDYFCSFCTIPLARGKSRNASIEDTFQKAQQIGAEGVKEIVLTGINLGDFGQSTGENFLGLLHKLESLDGISRIRISSVEPDLLSEDIIDWVSRSQKLMPHFHIPLQSGSDILLKSMRRKYDVALYRSRVEKIKTIMPNACIGADVIVGYPGETEEEFLKTAALLKDLDISYLHVFSYSERNNTTARKLPGSIEMGLRRERSKVLQHLSEKKRRQFYSEHLNSKQRVLWESENEDGEMSGYTENYIRVKKAYDADSVNCIQTVQLQKIAPDGKVSVAESSAVRLADDQFVALG